MAKPVKTKEQQLKGLVNEMFAKEQVAVALMCPWNLVRVLPKENVNRGGIVLPDGHNKLLYEGIIVKTWAGQRGREPYLDGPAANVGDHVLFPHYIGTPLFDILDKDKYRLIRDEDLLARLEYQKESVEARLLAVLDLHLDHFDGDPLPEVAKDLCERFDILPKGQTALTNSGK